MAIINMIPYDASPAEMEGAYCPLDSWNDDKDWNKQVILKKTHVGLCLREWERNMYDDSDFYMEVWNPEKGIPEAIMFATTRGWSYPCYGSYVDATDEVKEAYSAWKAENDRRKRVMNKLNARRELRHKAASWGVSVKEVKKLTYAVPRDTLEGFDRLLRTKAFRSKFRESLAKQVRAWITEETPKFPRPLSPKQMSYL